MLTAPLIAEDAAAVLRETGARVLWPFEPQDQYTPTDDIDAGTLKVACVVDVETLGLADTDPIIELAMVSFAYDLTGRIYCVGDWHSWLDDPGVPIPPEISAKTGITDEMVKGKHIPPAAVAAVVERSALFVAHHASFDRPRLEARWPVFADKPFACSAFEVPWDLWGVDGSKLVHVMLQGCGIDFRGHRAETDCRAVIHALATCEHEGRTAMSYLLQSARQPWVRLYAENAPRSTKSAIKARRVGNRRYRWYDGEDGERRKAWWVDVGTRDDFNAETDWLHGIGATITMLQLDALTRYAGRTAGDK